MNVKEWIKTMLGNNITEIWVISDKSDVVYKPHERDLTIKDFGDREIDYWYITSLPEYDMVELTIRVK